MGSKFILGVGAIVVVIGTIIYVSSFLPGVLPILRPAPELPRDGEPLPFSLPDGFAAKLYATSVPGVRVLQTGPGAPLYASLRGEGKIVALRDEDGNGVAERVVPILEGLRNPHGFLFVCPDGVSVTGCTLYVAEEDAVRSYTYDAKSLKANLKETLTALPTDGGGHITRTLHIEPDNSALLVSIGSSCNVCREEDDRRASIMRIDLATKETSLFARGLRNTVFMERHPVTGELWGTDMGRDFLGDELPPDEINILKKDDNYGWPICYGKNNHDTEFDKNTYIRNPCMEPFEAASHIDIPAHSAPLGLRFIPEEGWPEEWWFDLLVAYHGSWNRSVPTGYKIVKFNLDENGRPTGEVTDFMTGFVNERGEVIGRPVDILVQPGGVMYVSDDRAGAIYRISRTAE